MYFQKKNYKYVSVKSLFCKKNGTIRHSCVLLFVLLSILLSFMVIVVILLFLSPFNYCYSVTVGGSHVLSLPLTVICVTVSMTPRVDMATQV